MLPSPATIRWSSSSSLIAARPPGERAASATCPSIAPPSGSGPSAANAGHVGQVARSAPGRPSRTAADRADAAACPRRSRAADDHACRCPSGSIRHAPDMPRWKIIVSPRSVSISPYLARRPERDDPRAGQPLAEVGRKGTAQGRPAAPRPAAAAGPSSTCSRPRTVVSTSGSSGIARHCEKSGCRQPVASPPRSDLRLPSNCQESEFVRITG